jgi:hypothetical protein
LDLKHTGTGVLLRQPAGALADQTTAYVLQAQGL